MDTLVLDSAVEELELQVQREEAFRDASSLTEREHCDIFKVIKRPKVFEKVEYAPCVTIIDNR